MTSMDRTAARRRPLLCLWVVCALLSPAALGAAGCEAGGADRREETSATSETERVDSALQFRGQRRAIAEVVEEYDAAVRSGSAASLCHRVLRLDRGRPRARDIASCIRDPDNDALAKLSRGPGALDLVVHRIALPPRRPRAVPGIPRRVPRYQIEWDLEDAPRAVALAETQGERSGVTAFGLSRQSGDWRIASRWRSRTVEPPTGRRARAAFFRRHGVLGFYGVGRSGLPSCRRGAGVTHWIVPPRRASGVRAAVMRSNVGPKLRRAIRNGASLRISRVDYAGPNRTFALYSPAGREVLSFDAYGSGPRYTMDGIYGCRSWVERLTRIGLLR